jgi:hypothetical protein
MGFGGNHPSFGGKNVGVGGNHPSFGGKNVGVGGISPSLAESFRNSAESERNLAESTQCIPPTIRNPNPKPAPTPKKTPIHPQFPNATILFQTKLSFLS